MQAAADMPRPVGARCRDAAVCLALALLVASWLCAPAHGQPAHGQPAPGQPEPGLLGPEQPALEHPGPGLPAPGRPAPGRPAPGQPAPVQPAPGQPGPELPGPASHVCGLQFNTSIDNFSARPASMACMRARRSAVPLLPTCSPALPCVGAAWSGRPPMLGVGVAQRVSYRTRPAGYGPRPSSTGSWSTRCTSAARRVTRTPTGRCAAFCCCGTRAVRMGAR